jgi:hypothetical protein
MKALRIALVLCLGGFFPVFLFCSGQGRYCPGDGCPGGPDSISCRKVCVNQTPPPPTNPPQDPIPPSPTPTPGPIVRPPEDSNCQVNPLNGTIIADNCGSGWGAYVSPVILNNGTAMYICTCNSYKPPTGGGYCLLKIGLNGRLTNVLEIDACYQGFTPYIGRNGDSWFCKCVK